MADCAVPYWSGRYRKKHAGWNLFRQALTSQLRCCTARVLARQGHRNGASMVNRHERASMNTNRAEGGRSRQVGEDAHMANGRNVLTLTTRGALIRSGLGYQLGGGGCQRGELHPRL